MTVRERDLTTFNGWPNGKNTVAPETRLPRGSLREALDVNLDKAGRPSRRPGYTSVYSGTNIHSLWGNSRLAVFVENGTLKRLFPDYSVTILRSGLDTNKTLSYADVNGEVYYSNGEQTGKLDVFGAAKDWGVETPEGQPLLSEAASGALDAGRYQVSVAFVSAAGELSGATLAVVVQVSEGKGIQLTAIPQPDSGEVVSARIFVSEPNGEIMYRQVDVPIGVTSYVLTRTIKGEPLGTQFMRTAPAGHIVRYYNGQIYIASDNILWYTEALRYGLCKPSENYIQFPERITVLEPVDDGLYACSDSTYFLSGQNPKQMQMVVASPNKGVEGTGTQVSAEMFDIKDALGNIAFWFGNTGSTLGLNGGRVSPIMEDKIAVSSYNRGATLFKESEGFRQLITALSNKGEGSAFAASDSATAEVIRNGIVI